MQKLYLVTGFLGAGKTTLMKNLMKLWRNKKIAIIVNEFGKTGVDGKLLQEEGLHVEEINNGSIFCVCKSDKFIEALVKARALETEIILVETSGLADPTDMPKILDGVESLTDENMVYKGAICLIDALNFHKVLETAVAVKGQLRNSHIVLINKIDLVDRAKIKWIQEKIDEYNPIAKVYVTQYGEIKQEWLDELDEMRDMVLPKGIKRQQVGIQKFLINIPEQATLEEVTSFVHACKDGAYRLKGILELGEGIFEVEGVGEQLTITSYKGNHTTGLQLIVLAPGNKPIETCIKNVWESLWSDPINFKKGM